MPGLLPAGQARSSFGGREKGLSPVTQRNNHSAGRAGLSPAAAELPFPQGHIGLNHPFASAVGLVRGRSTFLKAKSDEDAPSTGGSAQSGGGRAGRGGSAARTGHGLEGCWGLITYIHSPGWGTKIRSCRVQPALSNPPGPARVADTKSA